MAKKKTDKIEEQILKLVLESLNKEPKPVHPIKKVVGITIGWSFLVMLFAVILAVIVWALTTIGSLL